MELLIFVDLLSYLRGEQDTSSSIDKSAPTEMGRPRPRESGAKATDGTFFNANFRLFKNSKFMQNFRQRAR